MTTFASSVFTGVAGTTLSTLDSNFTQGVGATATYAVNNTGTSLFANGSTNYYHATAPATADYNVTATMLCRDNANYTAGPTIRCNTSAQTYYGLRMDGVNGWRMFKDVAGAFTQLAVSARTFTVGNSYTGTVTVAGTTISFSAEGGAFTGSATDNAITAAGRPGIAGVGAESTTQGYCPSSWQADQTGGEGSTGGGSDAFRAVTESGYAAAGSLGGALDTLKVASETARGTVGAVAGAKDTFKPLIESGGGTVFVNVTASGIETFQHILESASGLAGAKGFASATLRHLTESATGAIGSDAVIGFGLDTFKPITETASAQTGSVASGKEVLTVIKETGKGIAGAVGLGAESLGHLISSGFGVSAAPSIQPAQQGFGGGAFWNTYQTTEPLVPLEPEPMDVKSVVKDDLPESLEHIPFTPDYKPLKQKISAKAAKEIQVILDGLDKEERAILDDDEQIIMAAARFFFDNRI